MTILTTFFLHLLICAFQINDYLKIINLFYSFIEAKFIVISIVNKRLRSIVVRKSINQIIRLIVESNYDITPLARPSAKIGS